jgi:hypothetical protein
VTPREALIALGVPADTADKFLAWHRAHPNVWESFERRALELIARGIKRYGAKTIAEVIRYHDAIERGKDDFDLNNNYVSYYARIFRLKHPQHKDFFEVRSVKGLKGDA